MTEHVFIQALQSILIDNKFDRVVQRQRTGKLDTKGLRRAATSGRVFKRKLERKNKQYDATIVLDLSGSMFSEYILESSQTLDGRSLTRAEMAADACEALHRCLLKANIPTRVMFFSDKTKVALEFGQKVKDGYKSFQKDAATWGGGGTRLAPAVFRAYEEALERPGKHIVAVISDGEPAHTDSLAQDHGDGVYALAMKRKRVGNSKDRSRVYSVLENMPQNKPEYADALREYNKANGNIGLKSEVLKAIKKKILFVGIGIQHNGSKNYYPPQFCDIVTAKAVKDEIRSSVRGRALFNAVARQLRKHVQRG